MLYSCEFLRVGNDRKASEVDSSVSTRSCGSADSEAVAVMMGSGNQGPTYTSRFLRASKQLRRALGAKGLSFADEKTRKERG